MQAGLAPKLGREAFPGGAACTRSHPQHLEQPGALRPHVLGEEERARVSHRVHAADPELLLDPARDVVHGDGGPVHAVPGAAPRAG